MCDVDKNGALSNDEIKCFAAPGMPMCLFFYIIFIIYDCDKAKTLPGREIKTILLLAFDLTSEYRHVEITFSRGVKK